MATTAAIGNLVGLPAVFSSGFRLWAGDHTQVRLWLTWVIGDTTEAGFQRDTPAGVLMMAGAATAYWGARRGRRWAGFGLSGGALFPWMAGSAALGLLISNVAWGWTVAVSGVWQPTFVPFVSLPCALVLVHGRGWAVAVTGAVLGAGLTTPIALLLVNLVCRPTGLPNVVGTTTAMAVSTLIALPLCRSLPWMPRPAIDGRKKPSPTGRPFWTVRRTVADFTEAQFYGNEWAGVGLIAGILLSYGLNPDSAAYGSGLVSHILIAQVSTAALGVVLWRRQWARAGWYPTFIPVVSIAPAVVLTYGGTVPAVLAGAVLGALVGPPLAAFIARRLPAHLPLLVANTMSMAAGTALIVPLLDVLPGFRSR
ncbi:hypothetical protein [Actinoplanes sp. M2I2]|uniref:hypothetical protein n=1 Tax=Actinoplanes sp. M2I2 TaxID=1734444 RepID=UPI00201FDA46|nr:hypothetical protein [Actinoplanes sp. M2I2]